MSNHVRISDKGRMLLNNKALAQQVLSTIEAKKTDFGKGNAVTVKQGDSSITVKLTTQIPEKKQES